MFRIKKKKAANGCKAKENKVEAKLICFECGKPRFVRRCVCRQDGRGQVKIHAASPQESNGEAGKPRHRTACAPPKDNQPIML